MFKDASFYAEAGVTADFFVEVFATRCMLVIAREIENDIRKKHNDKC